MLRKYIESKLHEDPVNVLKSGKTMELCSDTVVLNEKVVSFYKYS